jgi:hypothetical protein
LGDRQFVVHPVLTGCEALDDHPIVRAPIPNMACRSMAICHIFW